MAESDPRWKRQWELFHGASEAADPAAWLREHCTEDGDDALRQRVMELLAAADEADAEDEGFLPTDVAGLRQSLGQSLGRSLQAHRELAVGDHVGPYELLAVLGEGGMGRVFLARQRQPLDRRVALKVIRSGFETEELLARFSAERQILARLNHPHVAGVLDAGRLSDGRPYFAMEAVEGLPIDSFCEQNRLGLEERVHLLATVCEAVQHAHHKGIIHRDLKPSNVLVGAIDGRPVPKIIDFGIAKLLKESRHSTSPGLEEAPWQTTVETRAGRVLGTPDFMSPEQVSETGSADVDSRTDVYALGVLLSQLVRHATSRELAWIIERATAESRDERYSSCSELSADLKLYLEKRPVLAGPATLGYRFGKLVQRHRLASSILASALSALLLLTVGLAIQTLRLERALDEASAEVARRGEVTDLLVGLFQVADPESAGTVERSARDVLDDGAARVLDDLDDPEIFGPLADALGRIYGNLGEHRRQVEMLEAALQSQQDRGAGQLELADALHALGLAQTLAADFDGAEQSLSAALETRSTLLGPENPGTLATRRQLGSLRARQGRLAEGEEILTGVLGALEAMDDAEPLEIAETLRGLGNVSYSQEDYPRAEEAFLRAEEILLLSLPGANRRVTAARNGLARVYERLGRNEDAEALYRRILETRGQRLGDDHPEIASVRGNLALCLLRQHRFDEAAETSGRAVRGLETSFGPDHPRTLQIATNHAVVTSYTGDREGALDLLRDIERRMAKTMDLGHGELRSNLASQANMLIAMERWTEAAEPLRRLLDYADPSEGDGEVGEPQRMRFAALYGQALSKSGRLQDGERWLEESLAFHLETFGAEHRKTVGTWRRLEEHYRRAGAEDEAERWRRRLGLGEG